MQGMLLVLTVVLRFMTIAPQGRITSVPYRRCCGLGLGKRRWPVERSQAWLLENKRLALRCDRLGFVVQSLLQAACLFLVAGRLAKEFWKPRLSGASGK